jgi:hypothetical protein
MTIILTCLICGLLGLGSYWTFINYRRAQQNLKIGVELDRIVQSIIKENKSKSSLSEENLFDGAESAQETLTSPAMISTILTVIIHKFGNMKLSLNDFMIPDGEYISVYIDTATKELILSLNHQLAPGDDPYPMINFPDPDDNTFH